MDYTSLPIGPAKHIIIRETETTVEVLCQPQWIFDKKDIKGMDAQRTEALRMCNGCRVALDRIVAAVASDEAVSFAKRQGTVSVADDPAPDDARMTPQLQVQALAAASSSRAIRRAPWYIRVLRRLRLA